MAHPTARALYHHDDLRRLINPKVVAIVGASETRGSFGERTLSNMADFTGKVFAINPKYRNLLGRPCVPSLAELPESPDCVVLCVARPMVEGMIEAAAAVKAGGVIVYASGFAETAKRDRIEAQQRLIEIAQRTGVRVVGPNCVGLANTGSSAGLNFMRGLASGIPTTPDPSTVASGPTGTSGFAWDTDGAQALFAEPEQHKLPLIESLFVAAPQRHFILIGDSGERDPEIYAKLARRFPDQVLGFFIRDLQECPIDGRRHDRLIKRIGAIPMTLFCEPNEIADSLDRAQRLK